MDDVSKTAGGFAEKFKACRKKMNLSQQKVGELAGLSQNQISKYEKGIDIPSGINLIRFANIFNVSPEYLSNYQIEINSDLNLEKELTDLKKRLSITKEQICIIDNALDTLITKYRK